MRALALLLMVLLQLLHPAYGQEEAVYPETEWSKASGCTNHPEIKGTQRVEWYKNVESNTLVIFIHGIFSDNRKAWLADNCAYFPEMLSTEFPDASVILAGFCTSPASGSYDAVDAAELIWDRLNDPVNNSGMRAIDRSQIIFIAHSTGGLIARQIITAHQRAFTGKRIGLVLLASPTRGSAWADLLSPVASLAGNTLGEELQTGSQFLKTLDSDFQAFRATPAVDVRGIEVVEQRFLVKGWWFFSAWHWTLVDRTSAAVYFGAPKVKPNADHFQVAKPTDKGDDTFLWTRSFYIDNFARDVAAARYQYPNVSSLSANFRTRTPIYVEVDLPLETLELPDQTCHSREGTDRGSLYTCHLDRDLAVHDGLIVTATTAKIERADGRPVNTTVTTTATSTAIDVSDFNPDEGQSKVKFSLHRHLKVIARYDLTASRPQFREYAAGDTISFAIPYGAEQVELAGTIAGRKVSVPYRGVDPSGWIRWLNDDQGDKTYTVNWQIDRPH